MTFAPDIIVSDREGLRISLVVEVKLRVEDLAASERELKRYMIGNRCPVGMIFTPEALRIYRDAYRSYEEDSIERVGEFPAAFLFGRGVGTAEQGAAVLAYEWRLADAVQGWLETLRYPTMIAGLPAGLREAVIEHILPALFEGEVRAAGPRFRQTARRG